MKKKNLFLVWFTLAAVNLIFAISGRGQLYYLVAVLFCIAGVMGRIRLSRTRQPNAPKKP